MTFEDWEYSVCSDMKQDALWRMKAYRLALFAGETGWSDICQLNTNKSMRGLSNQLYRALGSIGANLAEGFSRGSGRDPARLYEYALGSAREAKHWYHLSKPVLTGDLVEERIRMLTHIIRLLLTMIPNQRASTTKEEAIPYIPHLPDMLPT